jgi:hypothetical protein
MTVIGRDAENCYATLPVSLLAEDMAVVAKSKGFEDAEGKADIKRTRGPTGFFLEPHTRRITQFGTIVPCAEFMSPLYKNLQGGWVKVTPELVLTSAPEPMLDHEAQEYEGGKPRVYDFAKGGIYSAKAIKEMDRFSQLPNLKDDIGTTMVLQTGTRAVPGHISPHEQYQEVPAFGFDILARLGSFFEAWGFWFSVASFFVIAIKLAIGILGLFARCKTAHHIWGMGRHMCLACIPSVMMCQVADTGLRWKDKAESTARRLRKKAKARRLAGKDSDNPEEDGPGKVITDDSGSDSDCGGGTSPPFQKGTCKVTFDQPVAFQPPAAHVAHGILGQMVEDHRPRAPPRSGKMARARQAVKEGLYPNEEVAAARRDAAKELHPLLHQPV